MAGPYVLAGTGLQAIAQPRGLKIEALAIPRNVSSGAANPRNLYHLGLIRWGNSNGYFPPVAIDADTQQVTLPRGMTTLGYKLSAGAQIRVTETPGVVDSLWDRRVADVATYQLAVDTAPTNEIIGYTYTVPSGLSLCIERAECRIARSVLVSSQGSCQNWLVAGGQILLYVILFDGPVNSQAQDNLSGGPVYLVSGQTLEWHHYNGDAGGQVYQQLMLRGFTFQ